jgi:hypothetical protein
MVATPEIKHDWIISARSAVPLNFDRHANNQQTKVGQGEFQFAGALLEQSREPTV